MNLILVMIELKDPKDVLENNEFNLNNDKTETSWK